MNTPASQNQGSQINAVNYAFLVLSTMAVALRFCGRYVAHRAGYWWDDWLSLVALVRLSSVNQMFVLTSYLCSHLYGQSADFRSTGFPLG